MDKLSEEIKDALNKLTLATSEHSINNLYNAIVKEEFNNAKWYAKPFIYLKYKIQKIYFWINSFLFSVHFFIKYLLRKK